MGEDVAGPDTAARHRDLIEGLYTALARKDGDAMAACYAPDARFSDPVFPDLRGSEPGAMWRMLTGRADDLQAELLEHEADAEAGFARWRARYTFTQTGRRVENEGRASFRFRDGLIAEHRDRFSFHRWSRQAFGPVGLILGWTPLLRAIVRHRSRAALDEFMADDSG